MSLLRATWLRNYGPRLPAVLYRSLPFSMSSGNNNWKLGDGLPASETAWKQQTDNDPRKVFTIDEMPPVNAYRLLTSVIAPRPIAFVSSLSAEGIPNLAPMSYFSMVSHKPALLSVSFSLSPSRPKDSRENILATKEFTVSIISEPFIHAANATAVEAPADVNEWIVSGLTMEPSSIVKPAFVHESAVGIECELHSFHDFADPADPSKITTTMVLGRIKKVHVKESTLEMQSNIEVVNPLKLQAIARMGGSTYSRATDVFDIARPSWRDTKDEIEELTKKHQEK